MHCSRALLSSAITFRIHESVFHQWSGCSLWYIRNTFLDSICPPLNFSISHYRDGCQSIFAQNVARSCGLSFEVHGRVAQLSGGLRCGRGRWLHCLPGLCLSPLLSWSFPWRLSLAAVLWNWSFWDDRAFLFAEGHPSHINWVVLNDPDWLPGNLHQLSKHNLVYIKQTGLLKLYAFD